MGPKTRLVHHGKHPKWLGVLLAGAALVILPLLTSYTGTFSCAADAKVRASEGVTFSAAPEIGHAGKAEINLDLLAEPGQKVSLSPQLIKTLGLDKLLLRGALLTDASDERASFDELLAQKLQRLGMATQPGAVDTANVLGGISIETDVADDTATASTSAAATETKAESTATSENAATSDSSADSADVPSGETTSQQAMPVYKTQLYDTGILDINDTYVEYVDGFLAAEAPEEGAALWAGSDATEDGFLGYFIGHNPGDFTPVLSLTIGDPITVYDRFGDERTYHVVDTFIVPNTSRFMDIEERLFGYGESIALQTCLDDNQNFLVVVAA